MYVFLHWSTLLQNKVTKHKRCNPPHPTPLKKNHLNQEVSLWTSYAEGYDYEAQAFRRALLLALGRAPRNRVITTSLSTLSPQNIKLNKLNKPQTTMRQGCGSEKCHCLTLPACLRRGADQAPASSHPQVPRPSATSTAGVYKSGVKARGTFALTGRAAGGKMWFQILYVLLQAYVKN